MQREGRERTRTVSPAVSQDSARSAWVAFPVPAEQHMLGETPAMVAQRRNPPKAPKSIVQTTLYKRKIAWGRVQTWEFADDRDIVRRLPYKGSLRPDLRYFTPSTAYVRKARRNQRNATIIGDWLRSEVLRDEYGNSELNDGGDSVCMLVEGIRWTLDLASSNSIGTHDIIRDAEQPMNMSKANGMTSANRIWTGQVGPIPDLIQAGVLENSPCNVLQMGKLMRNHGFSFEWKHGQKPRLVVATGQVIKMDVHNDVPFIPRDHTPAMTITNRMSLDDIKQGATPAAPTQLTQTEKHIP